MRMTSSRCSVTVTSGTPIRPGFGSRASASMARSSSAASRTSMRIGLISYCGAEDSNSRQKFSAQAAVQTLNRSATRSILGESSLRRQPFASNCIFKGGEASNVPAGPGHAVDHAAADRIGDADENGRDRARRMPHQLRPQRMPGHNQVGAKRDHLLHGAPEHIHIVADPALFELKLRPAVQPRACSFRGVPPRAPAHPDRLGPTRPPVRSVASGRQVVRARQAAMLQQRCRQA